MLPGIIHAMLFGGAIGGASPAVLYDDTIQDYALSPDDAIASLTFSNTGSVILDYGDGSAGYPYNWLVTGAAADYEISFNGGASYVSLSSGRNLYLVRSISGVQSETYSVKIRTAATQIVVASATITFWLEVNT